MLTGFKKINWGLTFILFLFINSSSINNLLNQNAQELTDQNLPDSQEIEIGVTNNCNTKITQSSENILEETSALTTSQRTAIKIFIELFWDYLIDLKRIDSNLSPKEEIVLSEFYNFINYYDLGKIGSNLVVDELIPNPKSSIYQKLTELLVPTTIAFIIINIANQNDLQNINSKELLKMLQNLGLKLFRKLAMVRFLQEPGSTGYMVSSQLAFGSQFFTGIGLPIRNYIDLKNGFEKLALDSIRMAIESNYLGETLKPKHRKKALSKAVPVLAEPIVKYIIQEISKLKPTIPPL